MDYKCRETIRKNMEDCGCNENIIQSFLECFDRGDCCGEKKILETYRKRLLEELHQKQKEIDLLDFMVYQLNKCRCSGKEKKDV